MHPAPYQKARYWNLYWSAQLHPARILVPKTPKPFVKNAMAIIRCHIGSFRVCLLSRATSKSRSKDWIQPTTGVSQWFWLILLMWKDFYSAHGGCWFEITNLW